MWIPLDTFVPQPAPLDMTGSDVLRVGYFPVSHMKEVTGHERTDQADPDRPARHADRGER